MSYYIMWKLCKNREQKNTQGCICLIAADYFSDIIKIFKLLIQLSFELVFCFIMSKFDVVYKV